VLGGIRLDFATVQSNPAQRHRPRVQGHLKNLLEQSLERLVMDLPKIRDRAEIRLIAGSQNPERHFIRQRGLVYTLIEIYYQKRRSQIVKKE
jgi:hypothetical protein